MNTKSDTKETEIGEDQGMHNCCNPLSPTCCYLVSDVTDQDHMIVTEAVDTIGTITAETETGIETEEM